MKKLSLPALLLLVSITAVALCFKYYLANAPLDHLKFLLYPLSSATELFYGTYSYFDIEQGYIFPELSMHIDRTCSGINFFVLLLCSASSYVLFRMDQSKWKSVLPMIILLVYPVAMLVNTIRIILLVYVQPINRYMNEHLQSLIHEGIGAACFFGFLVLLFVLAEKYFSCNNLHVSTETDPLV
jgi:exosortase K